MFFWSTPCEAQLPNFMNPSHNLLRQPDSRKHFLEIVNIKNERTQFFDGLS